MAHFLISGLRKVLIPFPDTVKFLRGDHRGKLVVVGALEMFMTSVSLARCCSF
jgi:hypothetical protein